MNSSYCNLTNVTLDIPVLDANRSFRKCFIDYCKDIRINKGGSNIVSIRALDKINLSIKSGDRIGLIGPNGAGKTSLLKVLAGIYIPNIGKYESSGRITSLFNPSIGLDMNDTGIEN